MGAHASEAGHDLPGVERRELSFLSGDETCAATLYRPSGADPVPCVVMANGFSLTRRDGIDRFAEHFAAAGLAALTFDFRHLGDSGGQPRQLIDVFRQRADLAAAIATARDTDGLDPDRVAVWGFSFAGGHVVDRAAVDDQLAAAVAVCPMVDGLAFSLALGLRTNLHFVAGALRAVAGRTTIRMPVTGPPGSRAVLTMPEALPGFESIRGEGSRWRNDFRARPSQPATRVRPVRAASAVRCPLFIALGERDTVVPAGPIERTARDAPRGELHRYPIDHFSGFRDGFDALATDQVAFLGRHLQVTATA